jgi:hypothetical protein
MSVIALSSQAGPMGGGRVLRQAQEGQHGDVKRVDFLLEDFIGELGEAEQAQRNNSEDGDRADLAQGGEREQGRAPHASPAALSAAA